MDATERLKLPLILPSQAQKHVTHNEALAILDWQVHLTAQDDALTAPPPAPAEGAIFVVAEGAWGAWAGRATQIAQFDGAGWRFSEPGEGWRAWIASRGALMVFHGDAWQEIAAAGAPTMLGINRSAHAANRLAVKSDGVLFSHDDVTPGTGDARLLVNRSQADEKAHLQFATGWTVNAEAGMISTGDFAIKVSPNGSTFQTAIAVNPANGNVAINAAPGTQRLLVREDKAVMTQFSVTNLLDDPSAWAGFSLAAAGSNYFTFQLYRSGAMYAYTSPSMTVGTYADRPLVLRTNTTDRITVHGDGRVSVGTSTASAALAVNGAVRVASFPKASLPSASVNGAGALIFVPDATGGAIVAFSDGAAWRRVDDRSVIA